LQYYDENWEFHDEYFEGLKARIVQHEYDHLDGILFVDKISTLKRKLINGKLSAITKGKVDVNYKIRIPK
jgi:peptide deformylase